MDKLIWEDWKDEIVHKKRNIECKRGELKVEGYRLIFEVKAVFLSIIDHR